MPVLAVDKPLNLTSHDVVNRARRARGTRRVGHTGTLDPLATGVLVLCVDDSTKVVQFMEHDSKDYLAWVSLGAGTPTLDAEGPVDATAPVPPLDEDHIRGMLTTFCGPQQQIPPQYSAIQLGGQRAYAVARAGGTLELPARNIVIHSLDLLRVYPSVQAAPRMFSATPEGWSPDPQGQAFSLPEPLGEFPTLLLRASVGSGTYLRSLARDLGAALGVPAHLAGLVRTRVGRYDLSGAVSLEDLAEAPGIPDLEALDFPRIQASERLALELRQGKRPRHTAQGRHVVTLEGQLVAVVDGDGEQLKVVRAWA
ncbi:tRNA pseudouridine(55) synthase TruB [Deinococcus deserti]|uniref:tRNA pseudouridine synthase B n=1 Tax=Deinococcus deserti (strain DSM 17065 / CIP 109153 / LMG 22923 / VCD115) TaxID=546414 RepID=TRUB_DEIDV|nr:tRNA pseudouridine(55) synthase TruB [Deinococcus deserti]C1D1L3.1 RecName: Full=tRNA pseudouridine synthase B; AltName: Full=tRNA pseudouridine(55) synthase; Short=Psi55 synthase; AltName: Full=tRNA pseudouridylate synthase; AltName: Full=tRNA-uridine isomerase [Deinococcus deserti VCD115]ACO45737.1 putative tRNA pseudouridylate synthase B [Deinococcus deserti VCD115]